MDHGCVLFIISSYLLSTIKSYRSHSLQLSVLVIDNRKSKVGIFGFSLLFCYVQIQMLTVSLSTVVAQKACRNQKDYMRFCTVEERVHGPKM